MICWAIAGGLGKFADAFSLLLRCSSISVIHASIRVHGISGPATRILRSGSVPAMGCLGAIQIMSSRARGTRFEMKRKFYLTDDQITGLLCMGMRGTLFMVRSIPSMENAHD